MTTSSDQKEVARAWAARENCGKQWIVVWWGFYATNVQRVDSYEQTREAFNVWRRNEGFGVVVDPSGALVDHWGFV